MEQQHVAFYLLSAASSKHCFPSKLFDRWKREIEPWRGKIFKKKKKTEEEWKERGRVCDSQECAVARLDRVCERCLWNTCGLVKQDRSGQNRRRCSCAMNQQWKSSLCLSASLLRIIWIKPLSWSRRTRCPTTFWAAGATLYVTSTAHLYLCSIWCTFMKASVSAWPPTSLC